MYLLYKEKLPVRQRGTQQKLKVSLDYTASSWPTVAMVSDCLNIKTKPAANWHKTHTHTTHTQYNTHNTFLLNSHNPTWLGCDVHSCSTQINETCYVDQAGPKLRTELQLSWMLGLKGYATIPRLNQRVSKAKKSSVQSFNQVALVIMKLFFICWEMVSFSVPLS